ncbi:flagellar basal body rod protein FlgC [Cereibacter sphaeroides]|uniref:flagellar basal body rod protein FlgC n=1 Tax=Rhodobacterales TaxID=204455 RepID=UPI000BBEDDEA|nr:MULTISPECIES: flagellar basal body rod protein FlgC [Paracoccaceae]MCE6953013.1 flagellar basal body rod protein FlgC [Cereibacter sphaeroides]MCE6961889.1 flagellar basal body rod protein FlgC [Cereibacter sphaeroides]MCE6970664.1 flagellar basal body rod protein FlgC [Cereibacter sphaeroides]MCE6975740.1 flagellar basal body rod protein FlgC [Cereibacter sphaeroides]
MSGIDNVFDVGARALSAQMVRMNTVASNLANAGTVAGSAEAAYRPLRPVFETAFAEAAGQTGLSTTDVAGVVSLDREPARVFRPDHPQADAEGYVFEAAVSVDEEMVEMMEASRQYQNTLEAVSTLRSLMARTASMGQ